MAQPTPGRLVAALRRSELGSTCPGQERQVRSGFTLIELLVSIALVILIMTILASAFTVGLDTFRNVKAIGDMSDRLRAATHQLRGDLSADHFEGAIRVSDPSFTTQRPREGFFCIKQFGPSLLEGRSDIVNASYRAPAGYGQSHVLHMSVKQRGNRREDFFGAMVPSLKSPLMTQRTTFFDQPPQARHQDMVRPLYCSQWAEVVYFLQPLPDDAGIPDRTDALDPAHRLPLFTLHRIIRVLIPDNRQVNGLVPGASMNEYAGFSRRLSADGSTVEFNTPQTVVNPRNRSFDFTLDPSHPATPSMAGVSTLLLTDVVSFTVQVIASEPLSTGSQRPFGFPLVAVPGQPQAAAFTDIAGGTWESSTAGTCLLAVQVTIRIWDRRTQQTRQITLIQDM